MSEILVHLAAGRSPAQKKAVGSLSVDPVLVVVQIFESGLDSKSRGGVPFSER